MKKAFFVFLLFISALKAAGLDLYVSAAGSDGGSGSSGAPFATLARARDAVRTLKAQGGLPEGGITVWIRGGYYVQADTLVLDGRDSGAPSRPVVYASAPGEQAHLHGARTLDPSWFSPVTSNSPVWTRLDPAARGQLYSVDLRSRGLSDFGTLKRRGFVLRDTAPLELFVKRRTHDPRPLAQSRLAPREDGGRALRRADQLRRHPARTLEPGARHLDARTLVADLGRLPRERRQHRSRLQDHLL